MNELIQQTDTAPAVSINMGQTFELQLKRAELLSNSSIIPKDFHGKAGDCFIVMEMADRLGVPAFTMFQNVDVVYGRVGVRGTFARALCQQRLKGFVSDGFEVQGSLPRSFASFKADSSDYQVRYYVDVANTTTGEVVREFGPWIGPALAKSMGWWDKNGSFWSKNPSMCERMCKFRAVSWYVKDERPNVLVGLPLAEELHDYDAIDVTPKAESAATKAFALPEQEEQKLPIPGADQKINAVQAQALQEYAKNQGFKLAELLPAVLQKEVKKLADLTLKELEQVEKWIEDNSNK